MNMKNEVLLLLVQTYQKRKEAPYMGISLAMAKSWEESPYVEISRDNDRRKRVNRLPVAAPKSFCNLQSQKKSFLSATSILSCSPTAHNPTASLEKLACANYVDFGKRQNKLGQFFWSRKDSNHLDEKLKVLRKDDKKAIRLVQNLTMAGADFSQFMQLRNQLVIKTEKIAGKENLPPVVIPTMSKNMDEQLKLAHKVVDAVDRANRKTCVILLRYNVNKTESSFAQVRIIPRKIEDQMFQEKVCLNYKLQEFIYILDAMNSVHNNIIAKNPLVMSYQKSAGFFSVSCFSLFKSR